MYESVDLTELKKAIWDTKKKDYVREGDIWTKGLIKIVKRLKADGFVVVFL